MEARYGVGNGSKNRAASVSDSGKNESATEPTTWAPVDLTDAIAGKDVEAPVLWERWDGERFIYGSRVHWFQGEPESCKSLAAQAIAAERLRAGEHVLYIDFEDDDRGVVGKLKALGVLDEQIASHFAYVRPDEPLDAASLEAVLDAHPYTLAVIDGVTEAMTVQGLELNSNADVASWIRMLPKRIASRGPATICIDHVTKASETRGRFAIGAQHKLAGTTGASYAFTKVKDFHRAFGSEPVEGLVEITVVKDRPGYVRGHVLDGKVGDLVLEAFPDGSIATRLNPPGGKPTVDMSTAYRILDYLATFDGAGKTAIRDEVKGRAEIISATLAAIGPEGKGWISIERQGRGYSCRLTATGREERKARGQAAYGQGGST